MTTEAKNRNSNLELLRIIAIIAILSHHFVVHSGVELLFNYSLPSSNMIYLKIFGLWGKTANNIFVLISGYFLCKTNLKISRFIKVYATSKFYTLVMFSVALIMGIQVFSATDLIKTLFAQIRNVNIGFVGSFLALYLLSPFLNTFIKSLSREKHIILIGILLLIYTIPMSIFHSNSYSYIGWYITLYLISAYIRCNESDWMKKRLFCGISLLVTVLLACLITYISLIKESTVFYYLICDSSYILAFLISLFAFLFFKNIQIGKSKIINTVSSTTFGVYLIHNSNSAFSTWLWTKAIPVEEYYYMPLGKLVGLSFASIALVYISLVLLDLIRIYVVERFFLKIMNRFSWFNNNMYE